MAGKSFGHPPARCESELTFSRSVSVFLPEGAFPPEDAILSITSYIAEAMAIACLEPDMRPSRMRCWTHWVDMPNSLGSITARLFATSEYSWSMLLIIPFDLAASI